MSKDLTNSASVAQIDKRLCFSIPARPLRVDVGILDLEPDTEILISTSLAGLSGIAACKAKVAIEAIERTIKRQGMDYYTMREIAEIMAAAHNLDACDFLKTRMHPAYKSGVLKLLDPKDGGFVKERQCDDLNDWVTPANLDKWLETEFEFRWPVEVPVVADSSFGEVELDKAGPVPVEQGLLTKDIAVCFGDCYYSANNWPKRLSGTAWLKTARIGRGEIGRASAIWNPLTLAQLMHHRTKGDKAKQNLMNTLNSRFTRNPALGLWRDAFNEYFATYCTTD